MSRRAKGLAKKRIQVFVALGAIGVFLATLFLPHFHCQNVLVKEAATNRTISNLGFSLEAFKNEFGIYPPSDSTHDNEVVPDYGWSYPDNKAMPYGRSALVYYLMGPKQTGWGTNAGNMGPFGPTTKTYSPFYNADREEVGTAAVAGGPELPVLMDAFTPPKPILYFRAEAGRTPLFDVRDNPTDPTGQMGFVDQAHFEMLARTKADKWAREDFLLISAGPDRIYGPVVKDPATGAVRPARPDDKDRSCDDVTNFTHP
jgi:hypothetical protein